MDTAVLVRTEREAAWQLLEELKKANFPMSAAGSQKPSVWMSPEDASIRPTG